MIVDDRPENLLALEAIIERDHYQIIKASSGEEALNQILKYEFATILLDVQMPGIDGFATARIIQARERTKNIPILFITANNMDAEHIFTGYSVGGIDYILKPFDPFILRAKVERFVDIFRMNQKLVIQASELSRLTAKLHESEALANVINATSMDSMLVLDSDGIILKVNPAVEQMFQYADVELLGKNMDVLFVNEQARKQIARIMEAPSSIATANLSDIIATRKDGTTLITEIQVGARYLKNKLIVAYTIRDITTSKKDQELIAHMAFHDGLTHLPNRRLFNEHLNAKIDQAKYNNKPLALLYLDLDRFKHVNDSLGHHIGDRLLQELAKRLLELVREDDFVARIGGDEFSILLPNTNRERTIEFAEQLLERFKQPIIIDAYELFITTSIGISIFPYDGENPLVLMKNSDAALYRAKEKGKNNYKIFYSGMNIQTYRSFILQNDLRRAIERKELRLVYQPRINLDSGKVNSVEALVRWDHPNWGTILPSEFIALAEESGQIVEIDNWVLRTACEQNRRWIDAGLSPVRVAVNFSAQQFFQKDLIDIMEELIADTGISTRLVEIEITESTLMEFDTGTTHGLDQLRKMGVTISLDDFGMGYSSLNYLRRLPVDTLKIDKSFVQDLHMKSPDSISLIHSIISMARSLKMSVIAEGVETEEQLSLLRDQDCQEIQGYLFCPPVPPEEFEVFLLRNHLEDHRRLVNEDSRDPVFNERNRLGITSLPLPNDGHLDQKTLLQVAIQRAKEQYTISTRETEVFELIIEGMTNKEISAKLFISEHTVKNHITHLFQKLGITDRLQAMSMIYQTCMDESQRVRE